MGKCNTVDDGQKWKSEVGGAGDGDISINKEGGDGSFDGKHEKTSKDLVGKCREPTGKPHSIWFFVKDNKHLYVGVFVNNKRIEGTRFKVDELGVVVDSTLAGDEDWVATKT